MNTKVITAFASALSLVAGAAAGFVVAQKRLEKKYQAIADKEIADAKEYYGRVYKSGDYDTPEKALIKRRPGATIPDGLDPELENALNARARATGEKFVQALKESRYIPEEEPVQNVFDQGQHVYIISADEFYAADSGCEQFTLTYYKDGALADEAEERMGEDFVPEELIKFGVKSDDPNTVFIRNEKYRVEYEIVRDERNYAELIGLKE